MKLWLPFFLSILERKETPVDEKEKALDALLEVMEELGAEGNSDYSEEHIPDSLLCERILAICIKWLASNEKFSSAKGIGRLLRFSVVYHDNPDSNVISRMIDNDLIFPWIFNRISSQEDEEHEIFFDILEKFARFSTKEDRDTIVIRYYNTLRKAISIIFTRDIIFIETLESFCWTMEIPLAILAVMPSELYRWANPKLARDWKHIDVCRIILRVLEISLESPLTLENLLGTGILKISANYSLRPVPYDDYREEAHVFRSILEKFPGFGQQFREWTAKGAEGNMVAELGRSIPPKEHKQGSDYVFYEEDKAI